MKKNILYTVIIFLGVVCASHSQNMPPAQVIVMKVAEKEVALTTPLVGIVEFNTVSDVSAEVEGLIEEHFFEEGDLITAGDPLVKLGVEFTQKDIEIIQKEIEAVDVKIESAYKNVVRLEKLFKTSASSEREYDEYYFSHKELIKQKERLEKDKERWNLHIQKSCVKAPFTGIVVEKHKNLGEWVSPSTSLCRMMSIDHVYVKVAVSEGLKRYLEKGQKIFVEIPPLHKEFQGEVISFIPVADMKSKTFFVKIKIPYFEDAIRNMSAVAHIPTSDRMMMKMVKRDALVHFNGKDFVYIADEGIARILPIEIRVYDGEYVGVESPGLAVGMKTIIDGNDRLQPDQPIVLKGEL
ncbi:efflux RND transporter periplasmic adaptor subunit [bacterium]|nr:efflux RND transporter periplasmic adaptor subunit [bacterium]MCP5461933.1 efflux RND transporter periplasmic adaptor subunit [bacterium]